MFTSDCDVDTRIMFLIAIGVSGSKVEVSSELEGDRRICLGAEVHIAY